MDSQTLITGLVTVGVGALSGGVTNAVAIWMLFHPYEPRGPGRLKLQGAMPKNKARLARSIGRTVGERLITPEDLAVRLGAPAVREAFDRAIGGLLDGLLTRERGPLRQELSPEVLRVVEDAVRGIAPRIAERVAAYARSDEFTLMVTGWLDRLRLEVADRPLGAGLTGERRALLKGKVERWVDELAEGDELEATLRRFVNTRLEAMAQDEQPLLDRLPPGLVGAVEQAITDYLPIALERLSALLADPEARGRIQTALRDAFDHSVRDLLLHERILAKIMVTDRTIERLVDGFEREGFDRFAESLAEPGLKAQVTRAVNDAVVNFLRLPLGERLRAMPADRREALAATVGDWLVRVARDAATHDAIARTVDRLIDAVERKTWGEVLDVLPPERLAQLLGGVLGGERGERWVEDGVSQVASQLLDRPLGQPLAWLGEQRTTELRIRLADTIWSWGQSQIPRVVSQLKVEEMVEQKVLGFSTQRMEEIVRTVTQRELDLIVRLGYVLGAMVGLLAFGVNVLLG